MIMRKVIIPEKETSFYNEETANRILTVGNRLRKVDKDTVINLAESIKIMGVLNPITVHKRVDGSTVLLAGMHRLEACKLLWKEGYDLQLPKRLVVLNEEDEQIVEMSENIYRKGLTKSERDEFTARVLGMLIYKKGKSGKKYQTEKRINVKKVPLVLFKPPSQKAIIGILKTSAINFKRNFTKYQTSSGVTNGWPKLTETEYVGFIKWFEDKAKASNEQESLAAETKLKNQHSTELKKWNKVFTDFKKTVESFEHLNLKPTMDIQDWLDNFNI